MTERPAKPRSDSITARRSAFSGSDLYVRIKQSAAAFDDLGRMAERNADITTGMIRGASQITDAMLVGVGMMNPFMPKMKNLMSPLLSATSFLRSIYSSTHKDITQQDWLSSKEQAANMISAGYAMFGDSESNAKLNHRLFTHNADGSLNEQNHASILPYFDPATPSEDWPNLILTSSHALVRDHTDVSGTMKGFHALITHCFRDENGQREKDLPLIRTPDQELAQPSGGKRTIMLASVFNDHNAWVNGGRLLKRLTHLDDAFDANFTSQSQLESTYMNGMCPAAMRLGKLMLKLIVQEPDAIDIDSTKLTQATQPIALRADAATVLQHIKLAGYSKGGNIVTDAVRFLILELQHQGAFVTPHPADATQHLPMNDAAITRLIQNVGILCVNPGISPLTARERGLGMRRLSIRNDADRISAHLFRKHGRDRHFGENDDVYVINGRSMGDLGHSIEASLGNKEEPGYLIDEKKVENPEALREVKNRLQCFFASCYNQTGISNLFFDPAHPETIRIECSTGTSDAQAASIIDALAQTNLQDVSGSCDIRGGRECIIHFRPAATLQQSYEALHQAFTQLHADQNNNLLVASRIFKKLEAAITLGSSTPSSEIHSGGKTEPLIDDSKRQI